jgi:hypothetical protein
METPRREQSAHTRMAPLHLTRGRDRTTYEWFLNNLSHALDFFNSFTEPRPTGSGLQNSR